MKVALGVSGGIAAYKACEIVRGLTQAGAEVQPILTRNATEFVTPLALQTLAGCKVLMHTFDADEEKTVQHIELARTIDALVVAPATANILAKFAQGIADDLLSTFFISLTVPVVVAPAMNTRMWLHESTQANLRLLEARGVRIVAPESGWLAEREVGVGRLAGIEKIVEATLAAAKRSSALEGRRILITAGPTRERIDPVRYLTNRSSGKMGFALAQAAAQRGAEVHLVAGPVSLPTPFGVKRIDVGSSAEMRGAVMDLQQNCDAVFMTAAVSDYVPVAAPEKLKKTGEPLELRLEEGPDILAELGQLRKSGKLIGFAAETQDLLKNAQAKLARKNLDHIVANDVAAAGIGFESDDNAVTILDADGKATEIEKRSKLRIAESILDHVFPG